MPGRYIGGGKFGARCHRCDDEADDFDDVDDGIHPNYLRNEYL